MGMSQALDGRFPYLDHRLFEIAAAHPSKSKLRGLREKDILRRFAARIVRPEVAARGKQPYRAPDAAAFFHAREPAYVNGMLCEEQVRRTGLFDHRAVAGLVRRCRSGRATGFRENQALVAILSTQLWHEHFFTARARTIALPIEGADVVLREAKPALIN